MVKNPVLDQKESRKLNTLLEDLSSLEGYVRDLFTFAPLPICFISPIKIILEMNPAFERLSGFKLHELVGEPIAKVFERKMINNLTEETLQSGFVEGKEMQFFPKDRDTINVQVFTRARKDEEGKTVGYFLGLFDLTKIKQTEKELKNAQAALLNMLQDTDLARREAEAERNKTVAIITNFSDGLLLFDQENKLSLINQQAQIFFKFTEKEVIGKSLAQLKELSLFKAIIKPIEEKTRGEEVTIHENLILKIAVVSIPQENEASAMLLVVLHDITEEKKLEEMKLDFASIAAHELRTPLTSLRGFLSLIAEEEKENLSAESRQFLENALKSSARLNALIESLLAVTKVERGQVSLRLKPLALEKPLQEAVAEFKTSAARKEQSLTFIAPPSSLPQVYADYLKVKEVLNNLLSNAVQYTQKKGKIEIFTSVGDNWVAVHVKDNGPGIPEKVKPYLFKKFLRGERPLVKKTEGVGLGLYLVKSLVEMQGGKVWFESEVGKGSTFSFRLPLNATEKR